MRQPSKRPQATAAGSLLFLAGARLLKESGLCEAGIVDMILIGRRRMRIRIRTITILT